MSTSIRRPSEPEEGEYSAPSKPSARIVSSDSTWTNPLDKPGPSKHALPPRPGQGSGSATGASPSTSSKPPPVPLRRSPSPNRSSSQSRSSQSQTKTDRYRPDDSGERRRSRSPNSSRTGRPRGYSKPSQYEDQRRAPGAGPGGMNGGGGGGRGYNHHAYDERDRNRNMSRREEYIPSYGDREERSYRSTNDRYGGYDYDYDYNDRDDRGKRRYDARDSPERGYRRQGGGREYGNGNGHGHYDDDYPRHRRRSRSHSRSRDKKRTRTKSPARPAEEEGEIQEDEDLGYRSGPDKGLGSQEQVARSTITAAPTSERTHPSNSNLYQPIKIKNRPTKRISDVNVLDPNEDFVPSPSPSHASVSVTAPAGNGVHRPPRSPTLPPPPPPPDQPPTPPGMPTPPPPADRPPTPPPPPSERTVATPKIPTGPSAKTPGYSSGPPIKTPKLPAGPPVTTPKIPTGPAYQPRVPTNKALDATKSQGKYDAHGNRADGATSVPHAPNRNLLNPTTRPTTPAAKAEPTPSQESSSKLFLRPTADEEMRNLNKSFIGTTTLAAYDLGDKLGEGTFGVVTKGIEIATKRPIALKKLITHNPRDGVSVTTVREIKILKALNHPNIVEIIDMVVERENPADRTKRGDVFMVFPYMDHDLCGLLSNSDFKCYHSIAKLFMRQILQGMDYIHANNFIHRDIKTANILVDRRGEIKIADFGLARTWTYDELMPKHMATEYTNMVVTRWYRAPELLLGDRHYGPAVDMWSLGCVLGEMYHRSPILQGDDDRDQLVKIFGTVDRPSEETWPGWDKLPGFPEYPGHPWDKTQEDQPLLECAQQKWYMDRGGADLMLQLLRIDPSRRLSAHEALDHPWFWVAPKPAVCSNDLLKVESSHEMTQKIKNEPRRPVQQPMQGIRPRPQMHQQHPQHFQQQPAWNGQRPMPMNTNVNMNMNMNMNPYANAVTNPYGGGPPPMRNPYQPGMAQHQQQHQHQHHGQGQGQGQNGFPARPNIGMGVNGPPFGVSGNGNGMASNSNLQTRPGGGGSYAPPPPFKLGGTAQARGPNHVPPPPFALGGNNRNRPNGGGPPRGPANMDQGLERKRDQGLPY